MSGTVSPVIAFNEIPYVWEVPGTYIEVIPNYQNVGVLPWPSRALIIGQKLAAGTAVAATPYPVTRPQDATALFGAGSQAEAMAIAWLAANQNGTPLEVMGLADNGTSKAAGTFTVAGTFTQAGTLAIEVGSTRYYVPSAITDTPTTIATALAGQINADPQTCVVATTAAGVLTVTAKNAGAEGNNINLAVSPAFGDVLPAGMTIAVAAISGGAANPSIAAALAAISGIWYTSICMSWQDSPNIALLSAELTRRQNAMVRQDALGFVWFTGTLSQQLAAAANADMRFIYAPGLTNPRSLPWVLAASLQGVAERELTNDPARQLRGLVLPGLLGSRPADRRIPSEEQQMLVGGVSTVRTSRDGSVTIQKLVSTYTVNGQGVLDPAYHEIHDAAVAFRIRYDWRTYFDLTYPRAKLTDDGSIAAEADPNAVTPNRLKASWAFRLRIYETNGWVENSQATARRAVFARDPNSRNRVNATQPYQRIGNMMVLAGQLQFQV